MLRRMGLRKCPGMCWHPAKRTALSVKQGGTADHRFVLGRVLSVEDFLFLGGFFMGKTGRFGIHGGQYIPEVLMNAVNELEEAYNYYKNDPEFNRELTELLNDYAGRPSRLYYAE